MTPRRRLWKGKCLVQDLRVGQPEEETANPGDSPGPKSLLQPQSCPTDASGLGSPPCGHLTVEFTGPFLSTVCCRGVGNHCSPSPTQKSTRKLAADLSVCAPFPTPQQRNSGAGDGGTREGRLRSKTTARSLGGQGQAGPHCPASCLPLLRPQLPERGQALPKAAPKRTFRSRER